MIILFEGQLANIYRSGFPREMTLFIRFREIDIGDSDLVLLLSPPLPCVYARGFWREKKDKWNERMGALSVEIKKFANGFIIRDLAFSTIIKYFFLRQRYCAESALFFNF